LFGSHCTVTHTPAQVPQLPPPLLEPIAPLLELLP
jgi:hypothetical protein